MLTWPPLPARRTDRKSNGYHYLPMMQWCMIRWVHRPMGEDLIIDIEMIVTYRVNHEGLIASLNAYWDINAVAEQLGG
jgi:hypothetical protein